MTKQLGSVNTRSRGTVRRQARRGPAKKPQRASVPLSVWIVLAAVAIAGIVLYLKRPLPPFAGEITVAEAYQRYQAGAFFLDVRTQAEYDQGHIANGVLIPLEELQKRLNEVPRDQAVVVVCKSGVRSREATLILRQAGYTHVAPMGGGMQAWVSAGYPWVK